jgi:hypothetical protein
MHSPLPSPQVASYALTSPFTAISKLYRTNAAVDMLLLHIKEINHRYNYIRGSDVIMKEKIIPIFRSIAFRESVYVNVDKLWKYPVDVGCSIR